MQKMVVLRGGKIMGWEMKMMLMRMSKREKRALDSDSAKQESETEDDCKQGSEEEEKIK